MSKKKNALERMLRDIALKLPRQGYDCRVVVVRTGEQLMQSTGKVLKDNEGNPLNHDQRYERQLTDQRPVNHLRRLRRAYENAGWDGVAEYINKVNAAFSEAIKGHSEILSSIEDAKAGVFI